MKKTILAIIASVAITLVSFSQAPATFNYQSVARDAGGNALTNNPLGVQLQLHQTTDLGTVVYSETHSLTTDEHGHFSMEVGNGAPGVGAFSSIDWSTGLYFLEVGLDPAGGSSYISMGTQQLLSVPYALYSGSSGFWETNGADLYNTNSGRIGIGTSTPGTVANTSARVEIADEDGSTSGLLIRTAGGGFPSIALAKQNGTLTAPAAIDDFGWVGALDAMYYNGSNYGTSSRILLQGDSASSGSGYPGLIAFQTTPAGSSTPFYRLTVRRTGNVGIGTPNPYALLDVSGDVMFNGLTVGRGAGNDSTNTAFGYQALDSNTTGLNNTASGFRALASNTTGSDNTATGSDALHSNTEGTSNTAFGKDALHLNTTGYDNTAIGASALPVNTTGNSNVAVGFEALSASQTTSKNTAVGARALKLANGTGGNTAFGFQAGTNTTTGIDNVIVGRDAFYSNTTGSKNTAVGFAALNANITGTGNTAIGYGANVSSGDLTNATAIGYNAIVGASNALVLGGTGVDGVNVGIGTPTPAECAKLELNSTSKGFLPPRMYAYQRNAIANPDAGLVIWCYDCGKDGGELQTHNGDSWRNMAGGVAADKYLPVVGALYQGGIIAYVLKQGDPGFDPTIEHGIIAASSDYSSGTSASNNLYAWGCDSLQIPGADATALGTGAQNTLDILNACSDFLIPAQISNGLIIDGYNDWYLPSKAELNKMFTNRVAIGGFTANPYWSSSEFSSTHSWAQSFNSGIQAEALKADQWCVRPIRAF